MKLKYKKLKNEKDITSKVSSVVEDLGDYGILIYLRDDELSAKIGFFTPEGFYPTVEGKYRLVFTAKSIDPDAKTWFKVFRKKAQ